MLKRKTATKVAIAISILLLAVWALLGTNASLAWFQEEDTIINSLNFGDLKVNLYHKTGGDYSPVDSTTKVFNDAALYEPGYTQVVYLKIENAGSLDFSYDMSVIPDLSTIVVGKNEKGDEIYLPEYLNFGLVFDETEDGLMEKTADRKLAQTYATHKLSDYAAGGKNGTLTAGDSNYCALILYMPEEVANEANYRGDTVPSVEVGIGVIANQLD